MKVSFRQGKRLTIILMVIGIILIVASMGFGDNPQMANYVVIGGVVCFLAGLGACVAFCRCPYCNHVIFRKMFVVTDCPHCKRNLETGLKGKKKKK